MKLIEPMQKKDEGTKKVRVKKRKFWVVMKSDSSNRRFSSPKRKKGRTKGKDAITGRYGGLESIH